MEYLFIYLWNKWCLLISNPTTYSLGSYIHLSIHSKSITRENYQLCTFCRANTVNCQQNCGKNAEHNYVRQFLSKFFEPEKKAASQMEFFLFIWYMMLAHNNIRPESENKNNILGSKIFQTKTFQIKRINCNIDKFATIVRKI